MGRAKSNTKRRPKGKRGWRKIDADAFINPTEELSLEEQKARIEQLRNSQLWSEDVRPRKKKKLTKAQKKAKAKKKLKKQGFEIESIKSTEKWAKKVAKNKRKQRLFTWKESQKVANNPSYKPKVKDTFTIKYKGGNKKEIKLNNHKDIKSNKQNVKANLDYNKNNQYMMFKLRHSRQNTKNNHGKDLWADDHQNDNGNGHKNGNDQSSDSEDTENENDDGNNDDKNANLGDIKPWDIIKQQEKVYGSMTSKRAVQNDFVSSSLISLPKNGESVNPMKHDYYYLRWKALQREYNQVFHITYQNKQTMKWYKDAVGKKEVNDIKLKELKKSLVTKNKKCARIIMIINGIFFVI